MKKNSMQTKVKIERTRGHEEILDAFFVLVPDRTIGLPYLLNNA